MEEIEISDFKKSVQIALANGYENVWLNCYLCNPITLEETEVMGVEGNNIFIEQPSGGLRSIPANVLSNWTLLIPRDHILNLPKHKAPNDSDQIKPLIQKLRDGGLPVNYEQSLEDLTLIDDCKGSSLKQTNPKIRQKLFSAVKKLENFPHYRQDSFKIGRTIVESWEASSPQSLPADVLIHLSYYRRWSKDITAALDATNCLEGPQYNQNITAQQRAILATERAATYLDLYKKNGFGAKEALRFLKYSFAANGGKSTPENTMCWRRYDKLTGRGDG